jgi:hypothetical protein
MSVYIDLRTVAQESLKKFPESYLYFLLDHGGLPDLHRKLQNGSVKWLSLFDCTNEANALIVAPILVLIGNSGNLLMSRSLFEYIGKKGTYSSTVIMLSSPLQIEKLKNRLTVRLDITISENMKAMLRFFDPRIFEGLMNVLSPAQIASFLAPAERWWYIDRAGKIMSVACIFNAVEDVAIPLVLNAKQEFELIDMSEPDRVLASLRENAPDLINKKSLSCQYEFVVRNLQAARDAGLTSIADLVLYNIVVLVKGLDFIKREAWASLMVSVKSNSIDFIAGVSSLDVDQ